jgi:prepilin peptidase CpaA
MGRSIGSQIALASYVFPLVLAALSDLRSLRIPNWLTFSMAAAFPVMAVLFGGEVDWLSHLAAGAAVFLGAAILFALRLMGGGDVKLLAAVALWIGLGPLLPFLVITAVIGGAFTAVILLLRLPVTQVALVRLLPRLSDFSQKKMAVPYGVPIAVAGLLMVPSLAFLG